MADEERHVALRSARDRIIDLAEIGDSYPLTDLNVVADRLKVPFGGSARIPIENAQAGVIYRLCDPAGKPIAEPAARADETPKVFKDYGKDGTLVLDTPAVNADVTYRVSAAKDWQTPRFLDERAPVKVGIDTGLGVEILAEPLDPRRSTREPRDARIVPYDATAVVRVSGTQEGVLYSLVIDGKDVGAAEKGNLGNVELTTPAMREDALIQVRSTKKFDPSDGRADETELLEAKRTLKVRPSLALGVSVEAVVEYDKAASVKLAASQDNVKYRLHMRRIPDRDFVRGTASAGVVSVAVPGQQEPVKVKAPPPPDPLGKPDGYEAVGEPLAGNGGELVLATPALKDDVIFLVQAIKEHRADPEQGTVSSVVWLTQPVVALVRPDPARVLTLRLPAAGAQSGASMQVSGGQEGVYYYFASSGKELGRPAYFHQRDDRNPGLNKGVGELAIGVDFAIAAAPALAVADRASAAPRLPLIDIPALAAGSSLTVRAVKAQTGLDKPLARKAQIPQPPALSVDPAVVDFGASAKVAASGAAEGCEFTLNDVPATLPWQTGPLLADTAYEVVATPPAAEGIKVELVLPPLRILVRPNAALEVAAKADTVDKGGATEIVVRQSQRGVNYQLIGGGSTTAGPAPLAGNGGDLALPTGAIAEDTTFSVSAMRADNAQLATTLKAQATVKVAVAPPPSTPDAQ